MATTQSANFQSEIAKLRHDVEEYAKQFPTIGFEKETMKYKNWEKNATVLGIHIYFSIIRAAWEA